MKRILAVMPLGVLVAVVVLAVLIILHPWGAATAIGVHPYPAGTPWEYQMWSGIIPALTILTLFGSLGAAYHVHNCHADGCLRLGKHRVGGTPWCSKHYASVKPQRSEAEILEAIEALLRDTTD